MKLKDSYITQVIDDTQFLVAVGPGSFNGVVRSNETAAFIVDCLRSNTTEEAIVDAMCAQYNAPRDVIAADVGKILDTLRGIDALEE
ncbi:MAG: PqqD family protein [Clostridia bacterium]|nr:PqqD family protein [Clostridia bacterium]